MKDSPYQVGVIRDHEGDSEDGNIYNMCLDVIGLAHNIKESYNSPNSTDVRFEDLSISTAVALSYSIWHHHNKILQEDPS